MEDVIESDQFLTKPNTQAKDFVDYFNLEYGLYPFDENEDFSEAAFKEADFQFIGFFVSESGQQRMYFSVNGKDNLFAVAVPLSNGQVMLSMTSESYVGLKTFSFNG